MISRVAATDDILTDTGAIESVVEAIPKAVNEILRARLGGSK